MSTLYEALKKAEKAQPAKKAHVKAKHDVPAVVAIPLIFLTAFVVFKMTLGKKASHPVKQSGSAFAAIAARSTPLTAAPVKKTYSGYELEGISCSGDLFMAAINGKLLKVGDKIDNWAVAKIDPTSVELNNAKDNSNKHLDLK
jgi:hypothetical protein